MGILNLFRPGTNGHSQANPPGPSRGILAWLRERATPWLGPRLSRGEPVDVEVRRQTVRSGPPVAALPWFLPYFDQGQTLGEHTAMRQAYRRMLADPNVKAAFLGKALAVCALEIKVIPHVKKSRRDNEIADFVRWNLESALEGGLPGMIWGILSGAMIDGYSVSEKVWEYVDRGEHAGRYCLRALKPKDTGNDVVLLTDQYRNVTGVQGLRYNAGEVFPPSRFAIFRHLPLWDQPTGMSDLRAVYSRWWMLDTVLKLRAVGLEKRALPIVIGHYQSSQQRPSVEAALSLVKSQNWLAVPEGVMIEALNIAGMADGAFAEAIRDLKHDIFLGIEGAVLQSLEGSVTDGRGDTSVHRSKADRIAWFVAQSIECLLNDRHYGVIPDLVDLNYAAGGCPRVRLQAVDLDEQLANLEIDEKLIGMGLALSKDDLYERYGRRPPDPDDPDDALDAPKGGPALPGQAAPFPPGAAPPEPKPEAEPEPVRFSEQAEQAELIAEVLYGLFGSAALDLLRTRGFAEWEEAKHPRDARGRFTVRGSAQAVASAKEHVGKAIRGHLTRAHARETVAALELLTVKQLREVAAEHGREVPKMLKADLAAAVLALLGKEEEAPKASAADGAKEPKEPHERSAADAVKAGLSHSDWTEPIYQAIRDQKIDVDHPAYVSIGRTKLADYREAQSLSGRHVRVPVYDGRRVNDPMSLFGKVVDFHPDLRYATVRHADGSTSEHRMVAINDLFADIRRDAKEGKKLSPTEVEYAADIIARAALDAGMNVHAAIKDAIGVSSTKVLELTRAVIAKAGSQRVNESEPWQQPRSRFKGSTSIHALLVRQALAAGKPVPAAVLADYPDLATKGSRFAEWDESKYPLRQPDVGEGAGPEEPDDG